MPKRRYEDEDPSDGSESENEGSVEDDDPGSDSEGSVEDDGSESGAAAHLAALSRLQEKDPEFYEFLRTNDKELLDFEDSGEDEPQDEEEEESASGKPLTASRLEFLKGQIRRSPSVKMCRELVSVFGQAVRQAEGSGTNMAGSDLFNDVVRLCLVELVPALTQVLRLPGKKAADPSRSKMWGRTRTTVKAYLVHLLKLLSVMKEASLLVLLLKHAVHLLPYFARFVRLWRLLLRRAISLWCGEEETVRVLSLILIVRSAALLPADHLDRVLKGMYLSFVRNTKFTSPTTWPMIAFMRRSLSEVYALSPETAYGHAFVYIRQLAIHLRNAVTTKKKEALRTVYNWQYVHCLAFWSHLLCRLRHHEAVRTLVYPLVQTILGTVALIPTVRYVPLRFHLVASLRQISRETDNFVPILPVVLDVLNLVEYNKKSSFGVRPPNFECCLKVTKSQQSEAGFKERCIAGVCDTVVDILKDASNSIGFPELALPAILQIKSFVKQCKVPKYNQQLKAALAKIEENSAFICEKRRNVAFGVSDSDEIKRWERNILEMKTPLLKFNKPEEKAPEVDNLQPKKKKKRMAA